MNDQILKNIRQKGEQTVVKVMEYLTNKFGQSKLEKKKEEN